MSDYLKSDNFSATVPMDNKRMKPLGMSTKFYRPMVVFDFDSSKKYQKCFSYSTIKDEEKEKRDGLINFKIPKFEKIMINCPILVPTKYLKIFDFKYEISIDNRDIVRDHLEYLLNEYQATVKYKSDIIYQYRCIKYNSDYKQIYDPYEVQRAHDKMINEDKVEQFCKNELKIIENNKPNY